MNGLHAIPREVTRPPVPDWMEKGIASFMANRSYPNIRFRIYTGYQEPERTSRYNRGGVYEPSVLRVRMQLDPNDTRGWADFPHDSIQSWLLPEYYREGPLDWNIVEFVEGMY